jgi:hypothetical protein
MDIHEAWVKGKSISEIARVTGRDRKTIRRLLQGKAPTERKQRQVTSKVDRFREYLLARMLGEDPVTNAGVLFDQIREQGYEGGRSILKEFMAPLREVATHKTTERFETRPGQPLPSRRLGSSPDLQCSNGPYGASLSSTGRLLCLTTPSATLPRNSPPATVSRLDPSTIRSAFHFSAAATISGTGFKDGSSIRFSMLTPLVGSSAVSSCISC